MILLVVRKSNLYPNYYDPNRKVCDAYILDPVAPEEPTMSAIKLTNGLSLNLIKPSNQGNPTMTHFRLKYSKRLLSTGQISMVIGLQY